MQTFENENDQVEVIRQFFRENGKSIVLGVVLGGGALFGWDYWKSHKENTAIAAANNYYQITSDIALKSDSALVKAQTFINEHDGNYSVLVALEAANAMVELGDYANAQQQLQVALSKSKDENLLSILNLRIARLQAQQAKVDDALQTLEKVTASGWLSEAQEVRGDIFLAKGDTTAARTAYQESLRLAVSEVYRQILIKKLANIAA